MCVCVCVRACVCVRVCVCLSVMNETAVWLVFLPVAPLSSAAAVIPALAAVTIALGLLSSVLLCHLLCFHFYLSKTHTKHAQQHTHAHSLIDGEVVSFAVQSDLFEFDTLYLQDLQ